jgi:hypothetical protein
MPDYGRPGRAQFRRMRETLTEPQKRLVRKNAKELVELNETLGEECERIEEVYHACGVFLDEQTEDAYNSVTGGVCEICNIVSDLLTACEVWEEEEDEDADFSSPSKPAQLKAYTEDEDDEETDEDDNDFSSGNSRRVKKNSRWKKVKTED